MKNFEKNWTSGGKILNTLHIFIENIIKTASDRRTKKALTFFALLIVIDVSKVGAEEITGTILFEPKQTYFGLQYLLDTNNDKLSDKIIEISSGSVGNAMDILPNYLVKGAKIVYENKGMRNEIGESISPKRMIAIITEDGDYIELTKLVPNIIARYFDFLYEKLIREGRTN